MRYGLLISRGQAGRWLKTFLQIFHQFAGWMFPLVALWRGGKPWLLQDLGFHSNVKWVLLSPVSGFELWNKQKGEKYECFRSGVACVFFAGAWMASPGGWCFVLTHFMPLDAHPILSMQKAFSSLTYPLKKILCSGYYNDEASLTTITDFSVRAPLPKGFAMNARKLGKNWVFTVFFFFFSQRLPHWGSQVWSQHS